jgi:hypothetical protein
LAAGSSIVDAAPLPEGPLLLLAGPCCPAVDTLAERMPPTTVLVPPLLVPPLLLAFFSGDASVAVGRAMGEHASGSSRLLKRTAADVKRAEPASEPLVRLVLGL